MSTPEHTAFSAGHLVATGPLEVVLRAVKARYDAGDTQLLVFADATGREEDFDLRGTVSDVLTRAAPAPERKGPGRPRLGVVAREVTLLPRHWDWLEAQPSGLSAALRRLVDAEIKRDPAGERARRAAAATHRVMTGLAGDLSGYEEAARALFAHDGAAFAERIAAWPEDVRVYLERLSAPVFAVPAAR